VTAAGRSLVLGVDGGNSKTVAVVADESGRVFASEVGGPSDIYLSATPADAVDSLAATVRRVLGAAGVDAGDLAAAVLSLAGADWPEDFELLEREVADRLALTVPPLVVNDAIGGLRSGSPTGEGIAVVCGTFNAVGARARDGRTFHCGFWPDRTGGFDLGTAALHAVYRDGLGLGPPPALREAVLAVYAVEDPLALMHAFTRRERRIPAWDAQRITPLLLDCADAGDEVAAALVRQAGGWLGEQGRVCAERVGLSVEGAPVVLSGGVLRHPSTLLAQAVMERLSGGVATRPEVPPVVGALLLAFDRLGTSADPHQLAAGLEHPARPTGAAAHG
jgi:N-acetylglucosamine kinase-like BadF-type ATPase